jgi:hypothetical protein
MNMTLKVCHFARHVGFSIDALAFSTGTRLAKGRLASIVCRRCEFKLEKLWKNQAIIDIELS